MQYRTRQSATSGKAERIPCRRNSPPSDPMTRRLPLPRLNAVGTTDVEEPVASQDALAAGRESPLPGYCRRVIRLVAALIVGAVLTGFAFLLLTGQYVNDGPVVVAVSLDHGVHLGDLFILTGWATGMFAVSALAVMPRRPSMRGADGDPAERQPASER